LVQRIESNDITICGSGSLIESHPKLRHLILSLVRNLNANKSQIKLELVKDGPLIGAAIIAATL
jgi:hexokinase